jgi:RNA polymerase sigma-70 factor (ECF subfamily)
MSLHLVATADSPAHPRTSDPLGELARQASSGDTAAIARLLRELAPRMIRSTRALLGASHPDVDDAVQQAMIGLVQALPGFRAECSIAHYASRIVVRSAMAARRGARTRGQRFQGDDDGMDQVPCSEQPMSDRMAADHRKRVIQELLDTLPEEQAEVIALRVVLGMSLGEVASATKAPLNTVRSRVRLAKEALRKRIVADPSLLEALGVDPLGEGVEP